MAKKIVISQGHGGKDGGSYGSDKKWERDRIRELAPLVAKKLKAYGYAVEVKSEKNANGNWAFKSVSGDFKVSLHFNAFNKKATGVEVLYKTTGNKATASNISSALAKAMGISNRGAKQRTDLYMFNQCKFNILIEVCFHDNAKDTKEYKDHKEKVAQAIADGIKKAVGGATSSGSTGSTSTPKPSTPSKPTATAYYKKPNYTGGSLIDALKKIGVSGTYANRRKIAVKNGIKLYTGTASQNTKLLTLLKQGKLKKI